MDRLLVADVGSTTTKAILFKREKRWRFVRREAPTTVEAPHDDVAVGLRAAIRALEEESGESLLEGDTPTLPLLLTSSAGGGLAMVVTGLVRRVTSRSAERAALGAGALVLDTIALDDGRVPYRKLEDLKALRPDILLFAGGFDGEAMSGPVFLAELVRRADLRPKLSPEARLPVVYAGNVHARDLVAETLGDRYLVRPVPNLRPESERENLEPARNAIHELFMEHVMSHAPGYRALESWVSSPILPTPSAVARLLELVTARREGTVLAVDVGGATTDVYTAREGEVFRTVSANLGMSYSVLNVAATAGADAIRSRHHRPLGEAELLDRLGGKYLDPTSLPGTAEDLELEWTVAAVAVREAVKEHLSVMRGEPLSFGEDQLSMLALVKGDAADVREEAPLSLEGYDLVVGSGGILSHSPREAAARMLVAALEPVGICDLAVDSAFMFPHLGVLSQTDPDLALELFDALALTRLGTLVAAPRPGGLSVRGKSADGARIEASAASGEIAIAPLPAGEEAILDVRGLARTRRRVPVSGGAVGLVLDARGRPPADRSIPFVSGPVEPPPPRERPEPAPPVEDGRIRVRRELAVPGDVFVSPGERVAGDTPVARCVRTFPRPFFVRVAGIVEVAPEELGDLLLVGPGDEVEVDQVLARRRGGAFRERTCRSPVAGIVERLLPDGTLLVREREDQAEERKAVQVAKEMNVPPRRLPPYLQVEPGQEVDHGQALAMRVSSRGTTICPSPIRGTVDRIDREFGIVLITPLREELAVAAWLPGEVEEVTERGAIVAREATRIRGAWGRGGEASGHLTVDRIERGAVVVATRPDAGTLALMAERGAAALVAGGMSMRDVLEADPPFPVVLTEGFGTRSIRPVTLERLAAHAGQLALVDGTTELRVGVRRPFVILARETG